MAWYTDMLTDTITVRRNISSTDIWGSDTFDDEFEVTCKFEARTDIIETLTGTRVQTKYLVISDVELLQHDMIRFYPNDPFYRVLKAKMINDPWDDRQTTWRVYV